MHYIASSCSSTNLNERQLQYKRREAQLPKDPKSRAGRLDLLYEWRWQARQCWKTLQWPGNHQTSTSICHSVFVPILLLPHSLSVIPLTYTGARSKPLFHFWYDPDLHNVLNKESYWATCHQYRVCKFVIFIFKLKEVACSFFMHPFCDQMMVLLGAPKAHTIQKHAIKFLAALNRKLNIIFLECYWVNEFPICFLSCEAIWAISINDKS